MTIIIKNHTYNYDCGSNSSIHDFKIINLDVIKEANAFFPFFFQTYTFSFKLRNVLLCDKVIFDFLFDPFKIKCSLITSSFVDVVFNNRGNYIKCFIFFYQFFQIEFHIY